ncbi:MAG: PD-(D/E)XK nuclease-like domain-containing protein [SAR324 cluster bacterium]|nr:PD-(D/E)XK nuclease-like domain-containing protein [SAR324 cluster bacterium]MBL7034962.1 PD-(D/E)XK nuclease-like domain-containing protein [SAR324 cluster bacterium]
MNPADNFGIVHNLPFEEYQQLSGLNQSTIKQWLSTAPKQHHAYKNLQALQFGSAGHCLLLEPERFEKLYVRAPNGLRQRGKLGKKRWTEFCEQHNGKIVLRANEWDSLTTIREIFLLHPQIKKLWTAGKAEVSLFWQDTEYGMDCKARLDWFDAKSGTIVDLKFTKNIGDSSIQKQIENYYAIQAAWYCRGIFQLSQITAAFLFVFIEKYAPYKIRVISVCENVLELGLHKIEVGINNISQNKNDN